MKTLKRKIKLLSKTAVGCVGFVIVVLVLSFGINIAKAAWEDPSAEAPDGNIYVPLNVGPENQAKKGRLLLDPLYNPYGSAPGINYPLEVRGPQDVYINYLEIDNDLTVDTDTLYVNGDTDQVGIGTLEPELGTKLEVVGGGVSVGSATSLVSGIGITASTSGTEENTYGIYGLSLGVDQPSIYGQGTGDNSIGVYGLNTSSGYGIYAESSGASASAVVGTTSAPYSSSPPYVAGIYARARGLGAWAGYFAQRLFGSEEIVGRKFVPNRLQDSQVPYTAGWKVRDIDESELINVSYMTFDGQYIWAHEGFWEDENIFVINPDNMEITSRIDLGYGDHAVRDIIDGGGFIWVAHFHDYGGGEHQSAVTKIEPSDNSIVTYVVYPSAGVDDQDSLAIDLLYDDQTSGGPYIWVLNQLNYGLMHSITQMDMDGNIIKTFSIDELANGGNKCSKYNNYLYNDTNHCNDRLDNDDDGIIDNGLCEYNALTTPAVTDSATCVIAGGTWVEACTDRTFDNQIDCEAGSAVWAETCSNSACSDSDECTLCSGAGSWDVELEICSETECNTQATCEGTITCDGIWTAGDNQCLADVPLGVCAPTATLTTWGECINAGETWTWNTASNPVNIDERIVDAYLGVPRGLTFDGAGNIWVTFAGAPGWDNNTYAGEGYARFNASNPDVAGDQYVYCSGPETSPSGIAYDEINNQMWISFNPSTMYDNRGISKVDVSNGQVTEFISGVFGAQIKYFMGTPGGPSIWTSNQHNYFRKIDPDTNVIENTNYIHGADFDFDERDPANPQILMTTTSDAVILKHTMEAPYTTSTNVILGAISEKLLFDGTNIWSSNKGTNTLTKYSAKGAIKLGVYNVGVHTGNMIFDGQAIWISYYENWKTKFKRIDIVTNNIDEYTLVQDIGETTYTKDTVFDGKNIWQSVFYPGHSSRLTKTDLSSCDSSTKLCSTGEAYNFADSEDGPAHLIYDGEFIWTFNYFDNKAYKFSTDPITMEAEITISEISNIPYVDWHYSRINTVEYDGTDIWVGAYHTDSDGNSIYKIDPKGINIDDGYVGVCSNDGSINCNFDLDCGGGKCNAVVVGKYPVFHMPGSCSVSGGSCSQNSECPDTETCDGMWTRVTSLTFDGINMWATHEGFGDHSTTGNECIDNLDNDGNGQCDFDGATGYPGCSGKPDPGCDDDADTLERTGRNSQYEGSNKVLTRIVVATGEIVESVSINPIFYSGTYVNDAAFDGQNIWLGGSGFDGNTLVQFYSGSGLGLTDLAGTVTLYGTMPATAQPGSFSMAGSANFGTNLIVVGDLVVVNNTWGGTVDNERDFGTGCDDGEFAKGVTLGSTSPAIITGDSLSRDAVDVAEADGSLYVIGHEDISADFRIEKRDVTTGELVSGFGGNGGDPEGVITGTVDWNFPNQMAIDSDYMYLVGEDAGGDWRVEKRSLTTGALCTAAECGTGFGYDGSYNPTGDGIVTGEAITRYLHDIDIDSTTGYMYLIGYDNNGDVRFERRSLLTGEFDYEVTGGSPVSVNHPMSFPPFRIILDPSSDYFYVTGEDDWGVSHIDKRRKQDGSWCTNASPCDGTGFGYDENDIFTGDGSVQQSFDRGSDDVVSIGIDSTYMYLASLGATYTDWRIEKRSLLTGELDVGFDSDGYLSVPDADPLDIIMNGDSFYIVGKNSVSEWRIEKRHTSDGSLCTTANPCSGAGFGTDSSGTPTGDGIVLSASESNVSYAIAIDSTYIYVVGEDDTPDWRIEKRLISTGEIADFVGLSKLQCRSL